MQNILVNSYVWWIKIGTDISDVEVPSCGVKRPSPTPGIQPRNTALERESPITSGCKNQWGLRLSETEGSLSPRRFLLKSLCRLTQIHSL